MVLDLAHQHAPQDMSHQATCLFVRSMDEHQILMAAKPLHRHPRLEVMYPALVMVCSHRFGIRHLHIHLRHNQWSSAHLTSCVDLKPTKNRHADDDCLDPLDNTCIHPEDYELARKMATDALELMKVSMVSILHMLYPSSWKIILSVNES